MYPLFLSNEWHTASAFRTDNLHPSLMNYLHRSEKNNLYIMNLVIMKKTKKKTKKKQRIPLFVCNLVNLQKITMRKADHSGRAV
jgi:hypothetical protein